MKRETRFAKLDKRFLDRWSPRSFLPDPISDDVVATLFEAARWSPSCFNEQPWLFVYARDKERHEAFASALVEGNRSWAGKAPLLVLVFARKAFTHNGKPNVSAEFDAGAAWMALCLQAQSLGLSCHAMAGFDPGRAHEVTGVGKDAYTAMCAIAIGRRGDPSALPEPVRERETPSDRRPLATIAFEGRVGS